MKKIEAIQINSIELTSLKRKSLWFGMNNDAVVAVVLIWLRTTVNDGILSLWSRDFLLEMPLLLKPFHLFFILIKNIR